MKRFCFENITARDCHVAASYFDGLPEQKIEEHYHAERSGFFCERGKDGCSNHVKRRGTMQ